MIVRVKVDLQQRGGNKQTRVYLLHCIDGRSHRELQLLLEWSGCALSSTCALSILLDTGLGRCLLMLGLLVVVRSYCCWSFEDEPSVEPPADQVGADEGDEGEHTTHDEVVVHGDVDVEEGEHHDLRCHGDTVANEDVDHTLDE